MLAALLFASPVAYADDPPDDSVIYISISGDPTVDIGGCEVSVRRGGSSVNTEAMFLSQDGVVYSDGGEAGYYHTVIRVSDKPNSVIDIAVRDDLRVDIAASGPCELNVRVDGPWQVYIDVDDEVRLDVEASDESQVFVDDQSLDNPAQNPDEPAGYQESGDVDDHTFRLDSYLAIMCGILLAAGLLAFFLIRRRAKNKVKKVKNERR